MGEAKAKPAETKKEGTEKVSLEKRQIISKEMNQLEKEIKRINQDLNVELEFVTKNVKATAAKTKTSAYSILDDIEEIKNIFNTYFIILKEQSQKKERFYKLQRKLDSNSKDKGREREG